jgi:hypothetical protein
MAEPSFTKLRSLIVNLGRDHLLTRGTRGNDVWRWRSPLLWYAADCEIRTLSIPIRDTVGSNTDSASKTHKRRQSEYDAWRRWFFCRALKSPGLFMLARYMPRFGDGLAMVMFSLSLAGRRQPGEQRAAMGRLASGWPID